MVKLVIVEGRVVSVGPVDLLLQLFVKIENKTISEIETRRTGINTDPV